MVEVLDTGLCSYCHPGHNLWSYWNDFAFRRGIIDCAIGRHARNDHFNAVENSFIADFWSCEVPLWSLWMDLVAADYSNKSCTLEQSMEMLIKIEQVSEWNIIACEVFFVNFRIPYLQAKSWLLSLVRYHTVVLKLTDGKKTKRYYKKAKEHYKRSENWQQFKTSVIVSWSTSKNYFSIFYFRSLQFDHQSWVFIALLIFSTKELSHFIRQFFRLKLISKYSTKWSMVLFWRI